MNFARTDVRLAALLALREFMSLGVCGLGPHSPMVIYRMREMQ